MVIPRLRVVLALSVLAAAAALLTALASEFYGGLVPCALCLVERWPLRAVIVLGLAGLVLPRPWARLCLWLVALVMAADTAIAAVHVGVEHGWWPSPLPECAAPRFTGGSITERLAAMPARPAMSCEDGVYPLPFVPVSFAGFNLIFSLGFAGAVAMFLARSRRNGP